jgi:hypothetical protein
MICRRSFSSLDIATSPAGVAACVLGFALVVFDVEPADEDEPVEDAKLLDEVPRGGDVGLVDDIESVDDGEK